MFFFMFSLFIWFLRNYTKTFSLGLDAFSPGTSAILTFYYKNLPAPQGTLSWAGALLPR